MKINCAYCTCTEFVERAGRRLRKLARPPRPEGVRRRDSRNLEPILSASPVVTFFHILVLRLLFREPENLLKYETETIWEYMSAQFRGRRDFTVHFPHLCHMHVTEHRKEWIQTSVREWNRKIWYGNFPVLISKGVDRIQSFRLIPRPRPPNIP